jgi:hypothetical protein
MRKLKKMGGTPTRSVNRLPEKNLTTSCVGMQTYIAGARKTFSAVEKYIKEQFSFDKNTVVVLGYNMQFKLSDFRRKHRGKRVIIYQLEQLAKGRRWWNPNAEKILRGADEVWDYSLENIKFLKEHGIEAKHVPLLFSEAVRHDIGEVDKEYDILFYGSLNERRKGFIEVLSKKYKVKVLSGDDSKFGKELIDIAKRSKIVLNIHYYEGDIVQEQARIFELLNNGVYVVSEKSPINYYEGIVPEFEDEKDMIKLIGKVLKDKTYEKDDVREKLKVLSEGNRPYVLAICFTYNELNFLKDSIRYFKEQGCNIYIIDNMSTDGTWEWLQENNIPSHRFDTKGTFHLSMLTQEMIRTVRQIKPVWALRFDSDSFIVFKDYKIADVLKSYSELGINMVRNSVFQPSRTGNEDNNIKEYWNKFTNGHVTNIDLCFIAQYRNDIDWGGDRWNYKSTREHKIHTGIFINYGNCKDVQELSEKKDRRTKAYELGEKKEYGTHYFNNAKNNWIFKNQVHYNDIPIVKEAMVQLINELNGYGKDI